MLDVIPRLNTADFPLVKLFLQLRALPARVAAFAALKPDAGIDATFGLHDFTVLGRDGDRECAFGLVGGSGSRRRPHPVAADDFPGFSEPGVAKLVMTFIAEAGDGGGTVLTTRTCVHCPDEPRGAALRRTGTSSACPAG